MIAATSVPPPIGSSSMSGFVPNGARPSSGSASISADGKLAADDGNASKIVSGNVIRGDTAERGASAVGRAERCGHELTNAAFALHAMRIVAVAHRIEIKIWLQPDAFS